MPTPPRFPHAPAQAGMYESFYLRAVSPHAAIGAWIRNTVRKPPGVPARGSVWCTFFDPAHGEPLMYKLTSERLLAPADGWIAIGNDPAGSPAADGDGAAVAGAPLAGPAPGPTGEGGFMGEGRARGRCGPASWTLTWSSTEDELEHLSPRLAYRAPLPRTKLTSPAPLTRFEGELELAGRGVVEMRSWPGMVGHNWGAEHAERWIWLHGAAFEQAPQAWIDVALGRVKLGRWTTPWVANGALSLDGRRHRIGGLGARRLRVQESPAGCTLELPGPAGLRLQAHVSVPARGAAGWRYADPDGRSHDVINCSVAALELGVRLPGESSRRELRSAHGGAYELGMRERDHGVPLAPFADG